ncbi:MAG: glycoside hydrolase family 32 protein [Buchananella hordeovulneris]|nr:glycoside hydrolase family 32 protein [Buchananella hordeovulneris]
MQQDLIETAVAFAAQSRAWSDPDYPRFHLAPPRGRLNDPNGLIEANGKFHAFFQYTPRHPHKEVFWGHASSADLTTWEHHRPAIAPDSPYDQNGAYSGTAIATPEGYELWYTGNYKDPKTGIRQATQCLVTSPNLADFHKSPLNPVIAAPPPGYTAHWRDPQVWQEDDGSYRMLLGTQRANRTGTALLYRSTDRREWTLEGEISFPDAAGAFASFGYMWECPNLFSLRDEATGEIFDVLLFCPQGIEAEREGFENVFPCIYLVGHLVGIEFRGCTGDFWELDRGFEFYAPQVFARTPDQQPDGSTPRPALLLGWAGNAGQDAQPSFEAGDWVHCMTVARELALRSGRLLQRPVLPGLPVEPVELGKLGELGEPGKSAASAEKSDQGEPPAPTEHASALPVGQPVRLGGHAGRSWRLRLEGEDLAGLEWQIGGQQAVRFTLARGQLLVDRSSSRYPFDKRRTVSLPDPLRSLEVLHDRSVTEVFLNDGELAFTMRSFVDDVPGVALTASRPLPLRAQFGHFPG